MTDEERAKLRELLGKEYLTEEERDELDRLLILKRGDPDFNIDEDLNNR